MNWLFRYFYLLIGSVLVLSCGKDDGIPYGPFDNDSLNDGIPDDVKYYENPPYPVNADPLRILAIGNSFTEDAMNYMDALVKTAGIDESKMCLYEASLSGATFNTWIDVFCNETPVTARLRTGTIPMTTEGTLPQLLDQSWDVIVIQQASSDSYKWGSYVSLKDYVDLITSACPNKNVCLAFQLVWSHTAAEMPYVLQGNIACCQKMSKRYGVDVIIPTGTAIQLARGTHLNDENYMTRDNWHLNYGIACYIASCTWFEALLRPVFSIPIVGNPAKPQGEYSDADIILAQQCAERAVLHPYESDWKN